MLQINFNYSPPNSIETTEFHFTGYSDKDYVCNAIRRFGKFYEYDLLEFLYKSRIKGGMFIDIGANIGNHSVYFGKYLADFVVCIEPLKRLIPILELNLRQNNIFNYRIYPIGLGAEWGMANAILPPERDYNADLCQMQLSMNANGNIVIERLDDIAEGFLDSIYFKNHNEILPIKFIKIDVEYMELDVLKGAIETIKKHKPQMMIEIHTPAEKQKIDSFLIPFGYKSGGKYAYTPTYHYFT